MKPRSGRNPLAVISILPMSERMMSSFLSYIPRRPNIPGDTGPCLPHETVAPWTKSL